MNKKIFARLLAHSENNLDKITLPYISEIFGVEVNRCETIEQYVEAIDDACLHKYFSKYWQNDMKKWKYSGVQLIDEVNNLKPRAVLDVGCGYNEFKKQIPNVIGVDPYNKNADIQTTMLDYRPDEKFDVVIVLGSINFGSTPKIFAELEHAVGLCAQGGTLYFRVNPGLKHEPPESEWISFYPWDANFITNCADYFGVQMLDMRNDSKGRIYFAWRRS